MATRLLPFLVVAIAAGGCGMAPPQATAIDAQRSHVALAQLQRGRRLLLSKCGGSCHSAPLPSRHTARDWPKRLDEMSARAGLTHDQRRLIEEYLVAMARR